MMLNTLGKNQRTLNRKLSQPKRLFPNIKRESIRDMLATEGYGVRPDPDETFVRNNQERYFSGRRGTVGNHIQFTDRPLASPKADTRTIQSLVSPLSVKKGSSKNKFSPVPSKMYLREQRQHHMKQYKYSSLSTGNNYSQNPTFAQNESNHIQIKTMDEIYDELQKWPLLDKNILS